MSFIFAMFFGVAAVSASASGLSYDSTSFARADSINITKTDSVATQLQEVVVEGRTQRVIKHGVEYIPDKKSKNLASDATSLLRHMQIPQLRISPDGKSVTTYNDKSLSFFIDYMPASENDLSGLLPKDVVRVEVLDFPDDPRFDGAQHVVNFVMRKYTWGGYTKLTASGGALSQYHATGYAYSKFVTGKWTLDANVSGGWSQTDRNTYTKTETFRDIFVGDRHYDEVTRISSSDGDYKSLFNYENASIRATYATDSTLIRHTISFGRFDTPKEVSGASVIYNPQIFDADHSYSDTSERQIFPSINGYYRFILPKGNTLLAYWGFSYNSNSYNSIYTLGDMTPISNSSSEDTYSPHVGVQYSKKFAYDNTLRLFFTTSMDFFNTGYEGSYDGTQKLFADESMMFVEYMQNWKFGLSLYSRFGASYTVNRVNGVNNLKEWNPRLGLQLSYQINDKHSVSAEAWWGNSHPQASTTNTALIRNDELMWTQGNPDLKNMLFSQAEASYTYIPTNILSLSATFRYTGNPHYIKYIYSTMTGYDGVVKRPVNEGTLHDYIGYLSGSLRLLNNSLNFSLFGMVRHTRLGGEYPNSLTNIYGNINASYSRSHWSVQLYYATPYKSMNDGQTTRKLKCSYGLSADLSFGDFRASLNFSNWFEKDRFMYRTLYTPHYSSVSETWDAGNSRSISVSLSYMFKYGKKVKQGDELSGGGSGSSAIMK